MVLMLSRPESGTLRTTWVTAATIALAAAVALGAVALGVVVLLRTLGGGPALWLIGAALLGAVAAGCVTLAVYGLRQQLLRR
jgi:hypothetical protein